MVMIHADGSFADRLEQQLKRLREPSKLIEEEPIEAEPIKEPGRETKISSAEPYLSEAGTKDLRSASLLPLLN